MRVVVIGAGNWGKNLVRNFAGLPDTQLVGVADLSESVLKRTGQAYPDAKCTKDAGELLAMDDVDAVVIATIAPTHFDLASKALEAGKHVYCEKPLTLTAADAKALVDLAQAKDRVLMVGPNGPRWAHGPVDINDNDRCSCACGPDKDLVHEGQPV